MARDVYNDSINFPGWRRAVQPVAGPDGGFYGEALTNDKDAVIVAVRGTADFTDAIDDLSMAPHLDGAGAEAAMKELVAAYCTNFPAHYKDAAQVPVHIAKRIFHAKSSNFMAPWANRVPEDQARFARVLALRAYQFCQEKRYKLLCFAGHSLGGAMSQYLSEQTGPGGVLNIPKKIPAISFNGPNMGTISGMRPGHGDILCVNSTLDPLSLATKLAGNRDHSTKGYIMVNTLRPTPPPQVSNPPENAEIGQFTTWFLGACRRYHGMVELCNALMNEDPGNRLLSSIFNYR